MLDLAWSRLSPFPADSLDPLAAIADHLAHPDTAGRLAAAEAARRYPDDVLRDLRARGIASVFHPDTATAPHVNALNAVTAARSGSLAITLGVNALALLPLYIAGTPDQLRLAGDRLRAGGSAAMLLTELAHGSNLAGTETRAEPLPDGRYRLTGRKDLINGGTRHDLLVTLARLGDGFGMFLVERDPTVTALPRWTTLPASAADISGVRLAGTVADSLIGGAGDGLNVLQLTLVLSRGGIGSLASGATSGALAQAVHYARERDVYGEPIVRLGAIAEHLQRMAALDVVVAAAAVKASYLINALGPAAGHFTAVAKYACCALAERAVTEGRAVLGARALVEEFGYAARVRDVTLYGVFDGTSHILLDQLQWRLERFAAGRDRATDPNATLADAYRRTPSPLVEVARQRLRPYAPGPSARCAALPGHPAKLVGGLFEALQDVVSRARASGRWAADQAWRFAAAAVLAEAEALLAACELIDPACRAALGLPDGPIEERDRAALRYALGWLGADLATRITLLSTDLAADAAAPSGTDPAASAAPGGALSAASRPSAVDLVAEFAAALPEARGRLRSWLERGAVPAGAGR